MDNQIFEYCENNNIEKIKEFFINNENINIVNKKNLSLLHIACDKGFYEIVKFLINHKNININILNNNNETPLFSAIRSKNKNKDIVNILLERDDILLTIKNKIKQTILTICADFSEFEILDKIIILIEKKITDKNISVSKFLEIKNEYVLYREFRLSEKNIIPKVTYTKKEYGIFFYYACFFNSEKYEYKETEILNNFLKEKKYDINFNYKVGYCYPLFWLCFNNCDINNEFIKLLLKEKIDINSKNNLFGSCTSLSYVCKKNYLETFKILITHKNIDIECTDEIGISPLFELAGNIDNIEIFKLLLKNPKVDINKKNSNNENVLNVACEYQNEEAIKILLECDDLDFYNKNSKGETPFYIISKLGNINILKLFLDKNINTEK